MSGLLSAPAPPAVRVPAFEVRFGSGSAAEWAASLTLVTVELGLAPTVDAVEIDLAPGPRSPAVTVGDTGRVSLGYAGAVTPVFEGTVVSLRRSIDGALRVVAMNGVGALARLRVNQSYEQRSAGEIVSDLARRARVAPKAVADGVKLPFYIVDDRRSGWAHVASLAGRCGFVASLDAAGGLVFGPPRTTPAQTFRVGVDVLSLTAQRWERALGAVTVVGEGAAGSHGSDAWSWLVRDPSGVTGKAGSGEPTRLLQEPSLRTADAARTAAEGVSGAAEGLLITGRLVVPGTAAVAPGTSIELAGASESMLNGACGVRTVRHRLEKRSGFVTTIDFGRAP